MKSVNIKGRIGGAILGISILLGIGATPGITTQAQSRDNNYYGGQGNDNERRGRRRGRNWDGYGNWGGSYELRQTALNAGYNEGNKEGRKDRSKGKRFDFYGKSEYQKGTKDYSSKLGDKQLYRRYFQQAYENGYTDGFNGY
ncbi:MAG TPA: hypothetical protein VGC66_02820 [Pyrinomonadaceae bacterium]|jgi:hypothetical protein